ncbi:MAG: CvpA family protein [Flavobacteriales bacterium]|nr:CvpA family protein [Flavobacteriales bacterium]
MENLPLAPLDIFLLLALLVGAWRGFAKGLLLSVASLVGLVGGIWAASHFSHLVAERLSEHVTWSVNTMHMASLALTFLLVVVGVHLLAKLLEKVLDLVALGFVNKLAGAVFGLLKVALILSFVMLLLNQTVGPREWLPESEPASVLVGPVEAIAPAITPALERIDELKPLEDKVQEKVQEQVSDLERRALENALPRETEDAP